MTGTVVPDALAALVDLFAGANITGLTVVDGPPYDVPNNFLAVGWDRSGNPAVTGIAAHFTAGGARGQEAFEVSCLLSLALGNTDMRALRQQIFTTYNTLAGLLVNDRRLGGVVLEAWISAYDLIPAVGETGDDVDFRFTVRCTAVK